MVRFRPHIFRGGRPSRTPPARRLRVGVNIEFRVRGHIPGRGAAPMIEMPATRSANAASLSNARANIREGAGPPPPTGRRCVSDVSSRKPTASVPASSLVGSGSPAPPRAVSPCTCRRMQRLAHQGCGGPAVHRGIPPGKLGKRQGIARCIRKRRIAANRADAHHVGEPMRHHQGNRIVVPRVAIDNDVQGHGKDIPLPGNQHTRRESALTVRHTPPRRRWILPPQKGHLHSVRAPINASKGTPTSLPMAPSNSQ